MSNFVLAVSFGVIGYVTWDLPTNSYFMVQLGVLGVFISGAME
jgi:hypothetical protein